VAAIDPDSLPKDVDILQKIVVDLCERLQHESSEKNKYRSLLRELLEGQRNRKSGQLSKEQLALFETLWKTSEPEAAEDEKDSEPDADQEPDTPEEPSQAKKRSGRQPLAKNLIRERIVHDLPEAEKHCGCCGKDLRLFDEEISERYEYIPASIKVIEDVRRKYACDCTVKTADKPAQPIEKSTAGASNAGACDREQVCGPPAAAPAGKDIRAPGRTDLTQDNGWLVDTGRRPAGSVISML
jgi:transposase